MGLKKFYLYSIFLWQVFSGIGSAAEYKLNIVADPTDAFEKSYISAKRVPAQLERTLPCEFRKSHQGYNMLECEEKDLNLMFQHYDFKAFEHKFLFSRFFINYDLHIELIYEKHIDQLSGQSNNKWAGEFKAKVFDPLDGVKAGATRYKCIPDDSNLQLSAIMDITPPTSTETEVGYVNFHAVALDAILENGQVTKLTSSIAAKSMTFKDGRLSSYRHAIDGFNVENVKYESNNKFSALLELNNGVDVVRQYRAQVNCTASL